MKINISQLKNTRTYLRQIGSDAVAAFRQVLLKNDKKATGLTMDSIRHEEELTSEKATIKIFGDESVQYINDGRPPNSKMPPSIFSRKGRRLDRWFGAVGIPRTKSADFLVRRKIGRDGIKPVPVLEEGKEAIKPLAKAKFEEAIRKDIYEIGLVAFRRAIED